MTKKKILVTCLAILLFFGLTVGFFALRFCTFDNGRVTVKDGRLCAVPDLGYRFESWSNGNEEERAPFFEVLFEKPNFVRERRNLPIVLIETFEGQIYYLKNWLNDSLAYISSVYVK